MINTLKRATKLAPWLSVAAILATAAPAFAQAPSQAQRDAIKSQCRSDYMAHCSSVPPGGEASLQCLQKNMSSLSSSCQSAVRAVEAPAAAHRQAGRDRGAESRCARGCNDRGAQSCRAKGCSSRPQRDSRPAHRFPPSAAPAAPIIRRSARACRPAARRRCNAWKRTRRNSRPVARKPSPPPAAVAQRLRPRQARLRPRRAAAAAAAPAAPTVIVLRPMRPREELFVLRSACGADVRSICGGVRLAAAGSCSVWRPMPPSFRRPARTCCPSSRRDNHAPLRRSSIDPGIAGHSPPRKARIS